MDAVPILIFLHSYLTIDIEMRNPPGHPGGTINVGPLMASLLQDASRLRSLSLSICRRDLREFVDPGLPSIFWSHWNPEFLTDLRVEASDESTAHLIRACRPGVLKYLSIWQGTSSFRTAGVIHGTSLERLSLYLDCPDAAADSIPLCLRSEIPGRISSCFPRLKWLVLQEQLASREQQRLARAAWRRGFNEHRQILLRFHVTNDQDTHTVLTS